MANPVVHIEFQCGDAEAQREFYGQLFGWPMSAAADWSNTTFRLPDPHGQLVGFTGYEPGHPRITIYVAVGNLGNALERVQDLGGTVHMLPTYVPAWGQDCTVAAFIDPEGNFVGICQGYQREATDAPAPNPVVHFEFHCIDAMAQQRFYEKLFRWDVDADNEWTYGLIAAEDGGLRGGIIAFGEYEPKNPRIAVSVQVDDLQIYLDRAVSLGTSVFIPPTRVDAFGLFFSIAAIIDPEGNFVGLYKDKDEPR